MLAEKWPPASMSSGWNGIHAPSLASDRASQTAKTAARAKAALTRSGAGPSSAMTLRRLMPPWMIISSVPRNIETLTTTGVGCAQAEPPTSQIVTASLARRQVNHITTKR